MYGGNTNMAPLDGDTGQSDSSFDQNKPFDIRNEVADLRSQLCDLRVRLQEVEDERNYNAAKANEYEEVLKSFKQDHVHEELVKKSLQVAEISMTVDALQTELKNLKDEKRQMVKAMQKDHQKMEELSRFIQYLQWTGGKDGDESKKSDTDTEETVLTPERALQMTLQNMKCHIEFLEDERQSQALKCKEQEKKMSQLAKDIEMKDVKIEMLEELFRVLSAEREQQEQKAKTVTAPKRQKSKERPRMSSTHFRPELKKALSNPELRRGEPEPLQSRNRKSGYERAREVAQPRDSDRSTVDIVIGKKEGKYVGPIKNGKPNGTGSIRFSNGDTYLGDIVDGRMEGKGTLYKKSGVRRGIFRDNKFIK